jgi:superfamily II DNA/RNA helicase
VLFSAETTQKDIMPKSKKPAGGRPAKNFEPRYGEKKPGSKSPRHRGYRPAEESAPSAGGPKSGAPKARWTATQRAGRDEARGIRSHAQGDRPARSYDDRPARSGDRPARSYDDRPTRSGDRKPGRRGDTPRAFEDRPARRETDRAFGRDAAGSRTDRSPERTPAHEQRVDVVHERLQAEAIQAADVDGVSFGSLGLGENIVRTLADLGATEPFAIQAATIPEILAGRDVLARGRTGSGKTIAFGAPLVERVLRAGAGKRREFGRKPKALILAPTRELALQIDRTIQPIARSVGLFTTQIYGGVPQGRQVGALKKGVDIIIGTPGRIEDLITQRKLDLSDVMVAVIDEADHMCELGFLEPVQRILRETSDGAQKLLYSATLDREVSALVDEFLVNPSVHEVAGEDQASSTIEHRVLVIDHRDKAEILHQLVDREGKTLVFARTRAYAEMLAEQFADAGVPAVSLHGDLNQQRRTRNLERLTSGRVNVLVATDVAARGIHVDDIDLVIQADAPDEYKTYLHRSGRTGRAGKTGRVVTLITRQRRRRMTEMLERAEIDAPFADARPGDAALEALRQA